MPKEKLINNSQLKKVLKEYTQSELIDLISDISASCPQAKEYLTVKFINHENTYELLNKYKQKVEYEFFPKRGFGRLNLKEAKKAISDFRKICPDKAMGIDILLFYVENCVQFTAEYGDINEAFYNSACSVYGQVVKEINSGDESLYRIFAERLKTAATSACEDWGFQDDMMQLYCEIAWSEKDDE